MSIKQDKTFGSITVHDVLYEPRVDEITELCIESITRLDGNELEIRYYYRNTQVVNKSQTVFKVRYKAPICVNKAKAIQIQQELRLERLKLLNNSVNKAQENLTEFIHKYF